MALKPKEQQNKFTSTPQPVLQVGGYPARVVGLIDLGVQKQKPYLGMVKPPVHKIMLTYELTDAFMVDEEGNELEDKPRWISEILSFCPVSQDKAKSTQRYLAIDPDKKFEEDFTKLIDQVCTVNVVINKDESSGKIYENVGNIVGMRERDKAKVPPLKNKPQLFLLDEPDMELWEKLPKFVKDKILEAKNLADTELGKELGVESNPSSSTKPTNQEGEEQEGEDEVW